MAYSKIQIAALHAKLDIVLKKFAEDNKLVAGASRVRYGSTDFKVEVSFGDLNANPDAIDPRFLRDLARNGLMSGLNAKMIGTILDLPGKAGSEYKFVGMRASKAVCICTADNKPYLWDASFIARMIAKASPAAKV